MATSNAEVSSEALCGLQDELSRLSNQLKGICETMNTDRNRVGEAWRDSKFQQFKEGFQSQIDRCENISVNYKNWCIKVLDPAIQKVRDIENADVVGNGGGVSVGGGSAAGTGAGIAGVSSGVAAGSKIGNGFNMGSGKEPQKVSSENNPSWLERNIVNPIWGTKDERERRRIKEDGVKSADDACKIDFPGTHAVPKAPNDPTARPIRIKDSSDSGQWNGNAEVGYETPPTPYGKGSAKLGGGYNSGKKSTSSERVVYYGCEPDNN